MANIKCNGKVQANTLEIGKKGDATVIPSIDFFADGSDTSNVNIKASGKQLQLTGDLKITGNIYLG